MVAATKPDGPAAETPEAAGAPAADVAVRIERAAALAKLNEPAPVPVAPADPEDGYGTAPTFAPPQTVPMMPRSTAFSGVTHVWLGGGEPYRVIAPAFPCVVDGLYQVANFGDVVVIGPKTADFGLSAGSIEPID